MPEQNATLAEIAAAAGVSVPTVSRVLNGRPGISAPKRSEIERLLEDRGYERRKTRRALSLIDFVISSLETQWATELLKGAQAEAARAGADLVVTATDGRPAGSPDWIERLATRGTDGVVLVVSELSPSAREELARLQVPIVAIDPVGTDIGAYATVSATDSVGGREATEHLIALGHRKIGFITDPMNLECHQDRLDGYLSALGRARLPRTQRACARVTHSLRRHPLLRRAARPSRSTNRHHQRLGRTGLRCVPRCADRGLRIPEDLSVVGFDDVDLGRSVTPQLTSVRQPLATGVKATRLVLALARGEAVGISHVRLASELVVRDSTASHLRVSERGIPTGRGCSLPPGLRERCIDAAWGREFASRRTNAKASGAPTSRSIPASFPFDTRRPRVADRVQAPEDGLPGHFAVTRRDEVPAPPRVAPRQMRSKTSIAAVERR